MLLAGVTAAAVLTFVYTGAAAVSRDRADAAPLVRLSPTKLAHCERSGLLRPVCPRRVPRVRARYLSNLSVELTGKHVLDVFNLERGGEDPRRPERNRPPRLAHVVAVAGNVERLAAFREPRAETAEPLRDGLMRRPRTAPLSFGRIRWAGRPGVLYLMPSFPHGGMLGNHLVFSWRERGRRYALSLHAWEPLTEGVRTLHEMVDALPSTAAAARLRRLSPVRRALLPRGVVTRRFRISPPRRREYAFDVFVVARGRPDLAVTIRLQNGRLLRVLDSTRSRDCTTRRPFRTCFLRFPKLAGGPGPVWTIVLRKRSLPATRVRVDVGFR